MAGFCGENISATGFSIDVSRLIAAMQNITAM
ncbi:histidyl-tRNA synthetase [Bartonella silvatica]|uniref:Histidyl-tRNA synthetase n=1 Tax=Bartonella silvatica TaxID=357760 RepID=A0ABV2HG84_9HYPH